jgi:dipeptidyl aminopeptidase/acylaminoacyl peptidase
MVGASYGGYAALVASFKTPDRLRCAVSFAGVSDLNDMAIRLWNLDLGELTIARLPDGPARRQNSPLQQVDKINVPLLLVHGDVDRTVMIEQSRQLVDALEIAGKPYRYIEQTNGDHHLSLLAHRVQLLEAMEEFLATNLAP